MTRTVLSVSAVGVALVVATMVSILAREIVPAAPLAANPLPASTLIDPSSNGDGKRDRLPVLSAPVIVPEAPPNPPQQDSLRQAYAADSPFVAPGEPIAGPIPMPRARGASRPAIQKNYTLLSDIQIAALRGRLRLTPAQEKSWPDVEQALRTFAKALHDKRQANPAGTPLLEADSAEIEQLKTAAMPLLGQLREEQKREVRSLARIIGLEAVASQI